jgi:hypothetical protein
MILSKSTLSTFKKSGAKTLVLFFTFLKKSGAKTLVLFFTFLKKSGAKIGF